MGETHSIPQVLFGMSGTRGASSQGLHSKSPLSLALDPATTTTTSAIIRTVGSKNSLVISTPCFILRYWCTHDHRKHNHFHHDNLVNILHSTKPSACLVVWAVSLRSHPAFVLSG